MATSTAIDGRLAHQWVRSVMNALFWEDGGLWTGKEGYEYGDPGWMDWRSSNTIGTFEQRAKTFVPPEVYAAFEAYEGE